MPSATRAPFLNNRHWAPSRLWNLHRSKKYSPTQTKHPSDLPASCHLSLLTILNPAAALIRDDPGPTPVEVRLPKLCGGKVGELGLGASTRSIARILVSNTGPRPVVLLREFARDLSVNLFLTSLRCCSVQRISCSNSLVTTQKHTQQSESSCWV